MVSDENSNFISPTGDMPYVVMKCAMTVDGYIDDSTTERLILSSTEDFDRVDEVRASCDAILIGAGTIRADNPTLQIRSVAREKERMQRGLSANPLKVTVTRSGILDPKANFFTVGEVSKLVYCGLSAAEGLRAVLGGRAEIVASTTQDVSPGFVLKDLSRRGVNRLLIEGGSEIATMFLSAGLVDELQVSVAPFFVGQRDAPRFVNPASFPHNKDSRMQLRGIEQMGDVAVLTFKLHKTGTLVG